MIKEPACKKCRRAGQKLFLKGEKCLSPKCPLIKRNYPPGQHGLKPQAPLSEYGRQLREKQKVKLLYNLSERQLKNYVKKALKIKKASDVMLYQMLERRLDNVITKAGYTPSRREARHLIVGGWFLVNGRKVTIPSYQVEKGDEIGLNPQKAKTREKRFVQLKERFLTEKEPSWMKKDKKTQTVKIESFPEKPEQLDFDLAQIIEFYSR